MARKENPIPAGSFDLLPLGSRMRQARQAAGATLGEVARQLGYSKAHFSAVENRTVRPSRELVAGYERVLALPAGTLVRVYDREIGQDAARDQAAGREETKSLDRALDSILATYRLETIEGDLVRRMLVEEARGKAEAIREAVDWWRTPGAVPVCCIPMAGWQWREWTREQIVAALDRAAAEAMQARIRELVVILPPDEIEAMRAVFTGAAFARRLQTITPVAQGEARGLGHAILQARSMIGERPFAVLLPDNHFDRLGAGRPVLEHLIEHYAATGSSVLAVGKLKGNRRNYGLARLGPATSEHGPRPIDLLAEKPDAAHPISCVEPHCNPDAVNAVLGRYVLSPAVPRALATLDRGKRRGDALELVDALQWLIDRGREEIAGWELSSLVELNRDDTVFVATYPSVGGITRVG